MTLSFIQPSGFVWHERVLKQADNYLYLSAQLAWNAALKLGLRFYEPFQTAPWNWCKCKRFDKPQELMCFALVLCCAAYTFDGSKSETSLNFLCCRHEVETSQEKAASCHFWHWSGFMGNISRTIFSQSCCDTSPPSSAKAILIVDMNQFVVWMEGSLSFYLYPIYTAILQMARERCHLEAAAGTMGDEVKVGAGVLLACLNRDQVKWTVRWKETKEKGNALPGNFLGGIKLHEEWLTN